MNLQQYAHELRQDYNIPNRCQFCGRYVDIELCHIMARNVANSKTLIKKLDVTKTQAYALLDCYGLNTLFGCDRCNGRAIGGGKTCKTNDLTVWNKTYSMIHADSLVFLWNDKKIDYNETTANWLPLYLDNNIINIERIKIRLEHFQRLFYQ